MPILSLGRRPGRSKHAVVWLSCIVLLLARQLGCGESAETVADRSSPEMNAPHLSSTRIVSLSAPATRFVTELGLADRLVGVDSKSAMLPGLGAATIVDLATARSLAPDLVLLPGLANLDSRAAFDLESDGARLVEFAPHDLEDVSALCRGLGSQLVGIAAATLFERRIMRPLALVGGISQPIDRLRVVAVIDLDPLTLAGGHSFETDLIEISGGSSVTHGGNDPQIVMTSDRWAELAPDLVLITGSRPANPVERHTARALVPIRFPVEFFAFDREFFWLDEPWVDAERMRALIAQATTRHEALKLPADHAAQPPSETD